MLGGSWVVISRVISRITILVTHVWGLITLLIVITHIRGLTTLLIATPLRTHIRGLRTRRMTTHEPPSRSLGA